jgi:uncharacterized protein YbjT (DUF2867 family)
MIDPDKYLLLTGATGLLGRSLVRDLSATGRRVAILVRGSKTATAEEARAGVCELSSPLYRRSRGVVLIAAVAA